MTIAWAIVFALGAAGGLTFIVSYAFKARGCWHQYEMGWHLMAMSASITTALICLLWQHVDGIISERIWFGISIAITAVLWWRVIMLYRTNGPPDKQ